MPDQLRKAALAWSQYRNSPLDLSRQILRVPEKSLWNGVQRMVKSVFTHRKTAVQAGHAMSKDWTAGMLTIMWMLLYWGRGKVIITAPTMKQVKDILFKEIATQYGKLQTAFPSFRKDWLSTNKLSFGPQCFAVGMTTAETAEHINSKFSGFHSPNMLIILSEAQDIEPSIYKQIRGLMTSPNSRLLELGNPVVPFGDFYDHCTDDSSGYNVIQLDVFQSPNIVSGREVIPGMASRAWLEEFQRDIGPEYEDDPEYQTRALAMFPQQSAAAWIPLAKIRACVQKYRSLKAAMPDQMRVGGLDVAGGGPDETVFSVLEGNCMLNQIPFRKIMTPETVGWARSMIENENVECFAIDYGFDPGVTEWLNFERLPVSKVLFGEKSPDEKFANMGTYIWGLLRTAIMTEQIGILNDPILVSQLSSRRIKPMPSGKLILESKKTSGQKSPDRADALALAWYMRLMMLTGNEIGTSTSHAEALNAQMEQFETVQLMSNRKRSSVPGKDNAIDDGGVFFDAPMEADDLSS